MKTALQLTLLLICWLALSAATYKHSRGGISLWIPDDWNVDIEEAMLMAAPPDDNACLRLRLIEGVASLQAAFERYPAVLASDIAGYRETQSRAGVSIQGMNGYSAGGEGKRKGAANRIRILVMQGTKGFFLVSCAAAPGKWDPYQAVFERILASIQPAVLWTGPGRHSTLNPGDRHPITIAGGRPAQCRIVFAENLDLY